ncbi:hypothetical protein MNY64_16830 (plasmid) [Moellerella wisconsensis]|nr:hypothetical protein [Moellerella wisconsensis]UNH28917.1 hypothetical protein MNY64_16830 [Moellerella wisconsensis]
MPSSLKPDLSLNEIAHQPHGANESVVLNIQRDDNERENTEANPQRIS